MNLKIGFSALRKLMSSKLLKIKDCRKKKQINYPLHDVIMSAFAAMFYQAPSLLQFQQELEDSRQNNNLRNQFGIKEIPSTTQLKDVLDDISSNKFEKVFDSFHEKMDKLKVLDEFKNNLNTFFLSADGTQYYTSEKISCGKCLVKEPKNGEKRYSHQAFQSAIVLPGKKVVMPIMPTEICNEDNNSSKQDCEWKAFFRHLDLLKRSYIKDLSCTILLDALFSDQVVVKGIRGHGHNFIIVSKPDDNKYLHGKFSLVTTAENYYEIDDGKYIHCYAWANNLPINSKNEIFINFVNYTMQSLDKKTGALKTVYKNTWITDHVVSRDNVADIVLGGRARWKVENECFNTLKNQGYNLEHSYGHGKKNLSFNFIVLTMLAFYIHQFLENKSDLYQACRKRWGSKRNLWEKIRGHIQLVIFDSFEVLLEFVLSPRLCVKKYNLTLFGSARDGP